MFLNYWWKYPTSSTKVKASNNMCFITYRSLGRLFFFVFEIGRGSVEDINTALKPIHYLSPFFK
jgi:hypothetical protein